MNKYILIEKFSTDFPLVSFYTARLETASLSETEKFIERFLESSEFKNDFDTIMAWIEKMGKDFGVQRVFFRDENGANALPPRKGILEKYTPSFVEFAHLRLYCIRLSDQIVILLNGGIKTSEKYRTPRIALPISGLPSGFANYWTSKSGTGLSGFVDENWKWTNPVFFSNLF